MRTQSKFLSCLLPSFFSLTSVIATDAFAAYHSHRHRTATATSDNTTATNTADALIPQSGWSLHFVDSEEAVGENGIGSNAFDGDPATFWHTMWAGGDPPPPHEIQIDLGGVFNINGLRYLPRQDGLSNGRIKDYQVFVSIDPANWGTPVASGAFNNDSSEKEALFSQITGRFVRLVALSEVNDNPWTSAAEVNLLGNAYSGNLVPDGTIDTPIGEATIAAGDAISFTGSGANPYPNRPLSYAWNFGDPAIPDSTTEDPGLVTFNQPGTYTVTFTVTDYLNQSDPTPASLVVNVSGDSQNPGDVANANTLLTLTWDASPDALGYRVYAGPQEDAVTTQLSDISVNTLGFDPQNPSLEYKTWDDLGLVAGDTVCFTLRAYNSVGVSESTPSVCGSI